MLDINCDMGEIAELRSNGTQAALLGSVTSINVSCGAHAGDEMLIRATVDQALKAGVRVGAHPGYPDQANFGRVAIDLEDLAGEVHRQLVWFAGVAGAVSHVKPHGAMYNRAAVDAATARGIAEGIARWRRDVPVMGLAGSLMLDVFRDAGLKVLREGFADRAYESDGTLRSRANPGALITDPAAAAEQALRLAASGTVDTICIHSDTPGSVDIAAAVRRSLFP